MASVASTTPRTPIGRKALALIPAALTAWAVVAAKDIGWPALMTLLTAAESQVGSYLGAQLSGMLFLYAFFGIPIALVASVFVGLPAWTLAERRGLRTNWDAVRIGALAGLAVFVFDVGVTILLGLPTALDPNASSSYGNSFGMVIEDGLPTPLGWLLKSISLPVDVLAGALAGWVARNAAGIKEEAA